MPKISALPNTLTNPAKEDLLVVVDDGDDETKKMTLGTLLNLIYPVGSIYTNATDDTNPATLLGFGTWVPYAAGRVLVGLNGSDTDFDTEEQTGGQKTVQAHSHIFRRPLNIPDTDRGSNSSVWSIDNEQDQQTSVTGSGVNNMNPYIVVHMWKRTA